MTMSAAELPHVKKTLLEHNYEFREQIGEGGYGTVFLVWSTKYKELFVAKKIPIKGAERVTSEVEVLMNLQHTNIINLYEYWCYSNNLYIIFEYCPNGSLKDVIKASGPLNPKQLWLACRDIASAIEFCHANNIVHRDIKAANLLVDKYNRIKLADFGLSTPVQALVNARTGSPAYMSPEAILGRPNIDQFKCDIWALGVTFYELATGSIPWSARTFGEMRDEIQLGLQRRPQDMDYSLFKLLKQMMSVSPEGRPTITEILNSEYLSKDRIPEQYVRRMGWSTDYKGTVSRQTSSIVIPHGQSGVPQSHSTDPSHNGRLSLFDTNCCRGALSFVMKPHVKGVRPLRSLQTIERRVNASHVLIQNAAKPVL